MQNILPTHLTTTALELNLPEPEWAAKKQTLTPAIWFAKKFPDQTNQFGCPFLEMRQTSCDGFSRVNPVAPNIDFFAAMLGGDSRLGHSVVYFEPELQFYYREPIQNIYKPTTPEKLQNYYRAMMLRCATELGSEVDKLNLFTEFRSDKNAKVVVQRAKSVLAADSSFFSATSPHQRIRGIEMFERVARKFVDDLLMSEPGQILRLADAYAVFRGFLKERDLPDIKRSDFKAVVGPLITENFNVCLRNDLDGAGSRGWKGVRMIQTGPS